MLRTCQKLFIFWTTSSFAVYSDQYQVKPLLPPTSRYSMNSYCVQRKIGKRDFYLGARGPYAFTGKEYEAMKSLGLDKKLSPSWLYPWCFRNGADNSDYYQRVVDVLRQQSSPFFSICYHAARENVPAITAEDESNDLWLGDGHPEYAYRLEPIFAAIRDEKSSWLPDSHNYKRQYLKKHALPLIKEKLPFYQHSDHAWSRHDYYVLSEILQNVTFMETGIQNALPWGMSGVGFYYLASQTGNRAVADKSAKFFNTARCRGVMRQFGGNKSWVCWRGFEPLALMAPNMARGRQHAHGVNVASGGYPYTHNRIYVFEPYLAGVNLYLNEGFATSLYDDVEGDGYYELSPLGHLVQELQDFINRHPDRGITYAPVALLMDWEMTEPTWTGTSYGRFLPFDDCQQMNYGILFNLLFPELQEEGYSYFSTTPYGDLFDLLKPNVPEQGVDPKALENYKVCFALGGLRVDEDLERKIKNYVKKGGTFIINAADCNEHLTADFLGLQIGSETVESCMTNSHLTAKSFVDKPYDLMKVELQGAEPIYSDDKGNPVVTKFQYGNGYVLAVMARYFIEKKAVKKEHDDFAQKKLLTFTADFMGHLLSGLTPIEVVIPEKNRHDFGWSLARKENGWVLTLINYSYERETARVVKHATAHVEATYPGVKVPVKLIVHVPVQDVLEWIEDRDIDWKIENGNAVIETSLASGEIKVIEIQPGEIELEPVERPVNHALNRPVSTSSEEEGHEDYQLVDGVMDRDNGWWSKDRQSASAYKLPQTAVISLEEMRQIDHIEILFHYWRRKRPEKYARPRYTRFFVETSIDGRAWNMVFDERQNVKSAVGFPLVRWFEPRMAKFVRLTVTENNLDAGAQVIEMKVFGTEREKVQLLRKPAHPGKITFPVEVATVGEDRTIYLTNLQPESASSDYLPVGKTLKSLCGGVTLKATREDSGKYFSHSLYAQANSQYVFNLNAGSQCFLAVVGFGAIQHNGNTVTFKVYVDDIKKYDSGIFKKGDWPKAVCVDVSNGKKLRLEVDDAGDGIRNDYAWWGDARLIMAE